MDLFSKFASRCENKDLCLGDRYVNALKCGDGKCAGLARAGLGLGDDVALLNDG